MWYNKHRLLVRLLIIVTSLLFYLSQVSGEVFARFIWSG